MPLKASTAGEQLFLFIRDRVLEGVGQGQVRWSTAAPLWEAMGDDRYSRYFRGAVTVQILRRLLRHWGDARSSLPNEAQHVAKVRSFVRHEVFPGLDTMLETQLARLVVNAEAASQKDVSRSVRSAVLATRGQLRCYLCAEELNRKADADTPTAPTIEHLWPRSLGGDSVEENLLPACGGCQKTTQDTVSWEWLNAHNLVLPPRPSEAAVNSIGPRVRGARHFMHAVDVAERQGLTLKEAMLRLGPIKRPVTWINTDLPITFFDIQTAEEP